MTTLSAEFTLYIADAHSLKDKRMVARSLIDRIRHKFNAAIAEVDMQDMHQTLVLGVAVVSGEAHHARSQLDAIVRFIERCEDAELMEVACD